MISNIVIALSLCLLAGAQQSYQLVWSDEFNGNSLNTSNWQFEVNCNGGGNAELQCYTSNPANLAVSNGALAITAIPNPSSGDGRPYSSARITTRGMQAWKYGRIEFSAKMPSGKYLWPALWMMPRDGVYGGGWWAASGEIDIMEHRGLTNQVESTLHYGGGYPNNVYTGSGPQTMNFDMTAGFHSYTAVWTPDRIDFLIDNIVYYTENLQRNFWSGKGPNPYTDIRQPFDQYFFLIINLAVGGNFFGGDSQALTLAQARGWAQPTFYVDYVRVYQLQNSPVVPNPVPVPNPAPTVAATTSSVAATPVATSSGCPVGACGAASCCNDQRNGIQCYDRTLYTCAQDGYDGSKFGLCSGLNAGVCRGACYNPTQYTCKNGGLVLGGSPIATPSTQNNVAATTSSAAQIAATSTPPSCDAGNCGAGLCSCNGACYVPGQYNCAYDSVTGKKQMCQGNSGSCNGACFNPSQYKCANGGIQQL